MISASVPVSQGGAGGEAISMGFGCAREDVPAVMALFAEVIRSPALPQPKLDLYKAQARPLRASSPAEACLAFQNPQRLDPRPRHLWRHWLPWEMDGSLCALAL